MFAMIMLVGLYMAIAMYSAYFVASAIVVGVLFKLMFIKPILFNFESVLLYASDYPGAGLLGCHCQCQDVPLTSFGLGVENALCGMDQAINLSTYPLYQRVIIAHFVVVMLKVVIYKIGEYWYNSRIRLEGVQTEVESGNDQYLFLSRRPGFEAKVGLFILTAVAILAVSK